MNILAWILVGLIAGVLARWIVRDDRSGCLYTIAVGVLGALIGGALMHASGHTGINKFSLRSLLVAALGAVLLLLVLQAIAVGRAACVASLPRPQPARSWRTRGSGRPTTFLRFRPMTTSGRCMSFQRLCFNSTATTRSPGRYCPGIGWRAELVL